MPKNRPDNLTLDAIGHLDEYGDDELLVVREKLIADIERIHQESAHHAKRIRELNVARHNLAQTGAERGRALRAIKNELSQRQRQDRLPHTTLVASRRRAAR
jgi:hypothetical protein